MDINKDNIDQLADLIRGLVADGTDGKITITINLESLKDTESEKVEKQSSSDKNVGNLTDGELSREEKQKMFNPYAYEMYTLPRSDKEAEHMKLNLILGIRKKDIAISTAARWLVALVKDPNACVFAPKFLVEDGKVVNEIEKRFASLTMPGDEYARHNARCRLRGLQQHCKHYLGKELYLCLY